MLKRRILPWMLTMLIVATMFSSVMAASERFSLNLPMYQGSKKVGTLARESNDTDYFYVYTTAMGNGYENVIAWTQNSSGYALSSKYYNLDVGTYNNIDYTTIPTAGTVVNLYMKNPAYSSTTPQIVGYWSPN